MARRSTSGAAGTAAAETEETGAGTILRLAGRVTVATLGELERALPAPARGRPLVIDLSGVEALDTAGAWRILTLRREAEAAGSAVAFHGASEAQRDLLETVAASLEAAGIEEEAPRRGALDLVAALGQRTAEAGRGLVEVVGFFGLVLARIGAAAVRPRRLRMTALVHQMQVVGLNAVPIVSLMAFLIGVVLAFQGATQLRQFGAEIFVVDLIAISVLRELGILLTAIIVAGRSGSAFTAAIGSMKIREELDAMRTLGLDPVEVLILPRVLALLLVLPLLGFVANVAGLFGGALMSWIELGVSPGMFLTRLQDNTSVWHLGVGFIKAPFFALIIGVIGCFQGLQVKGSSESVGLLTTRSVVLSIFCVIVADAVFSVFFAEIGV